jgi:hypothetical protein
MSGHGQRLRGSRSPPSRERCVVRFAGIDIGSEEHVVAVLDERNEVIVKATTFTEDAAGYGES